MKHNFKGWNSVYGFTFRQATKGLGFKLVTTLITILIIGIFILVNVLEAKPKKADQMKVSPIEKVFVLDHSGLQPTNYKEINQEFSSEKFENIEFVIAAEQSREDVIETAASDSSQSIAVIISTTEAGYEIEAVIPANSSITNKQAKAVLGPISSSFESNKLMQAGLSVDQLTTVLKPVVTSFSDIGENTDGMVLAIKILAPTLFGFMLYMMLLLYGQTISTSVSTEKTSKLMETLLTSVHPYALITGKVLAITSMALLQFVTWIVAIFVGLYGGNMVAHSMYPDYENSVVTIMNFFKDNLGETALSLPAILLGVLCFCIGFLFYSVIAGLAGCMVSKPEDVATTQSLFQLPIIASWLISYLPILNGNDAILAVARYIPFTAPFCVPVDIITGTVGISEGIFMMVILSIFTLLIVMLSGRIYKGLVLFSGQKVSFKLIGNILRTNK